MQHCDTGEKFNLDPRAAKGPNPSCRLRFQGHDIPCRGVRDNVSELFQIKGRISSRPEYLLGFLLPFAWSWNITPEARAFL